VAAAIDVTLRVLVDGSARALDRWTPDGSAPSQAAGSPGAASAGSIDAVLLVGGGSHTPGLPQALARRIGLTDSRIAVRDRKAVRDAVGQDRLSGADAVTALGIALRAVRGKEMPPVRVRINGRPVSLFQPDRCTVQEAARIAGIPVAQLMGRPGPGITVTLNGVVTALPGTRGRPAAVTVNGQAASLDTRLKNQDEITLKLPTPGSPPVVTVADMAARWLEQREREGIRRPRVRFNGVERPLPVWLERNRRRALPTDLIEDRDVIDVRFVATASELVMALQDAETKPAAHMEAGAAGTADHDGAARPPRRPAGTCTVNGLPVELSQFATLLRNGRPARWSDPVSDGDVWELRHDEPVTVGRVLEHLGLAPQRAIHIVLNGQPTNVLLPVDIQINAAPVTADAPVHPGDEIEVESTGPVALYQILPYAGVSPESLATSGRLVLQVRGQRAGFTTPVSDGDHVVIRYEP